MANDAAERKTAFRIAAGHVFESLQHPILIEATVAKICIGVGAQLELPALPRGRRIDPRPGQPLHMIVMLPWVYHVNGFVATLEPVFDERKQHSIFFLVAVKKDSSEKIVGRFGLGQFAK
jgi:hypothetical protein